ncbi:helix-hairpin-helix domain-containing protein [Streptomyces alboflavus]|uniref:helix-hairpin-helix domain-containing protein n=1 Tax=Streptomyces alboflavus TaxID=67267 RepID=UPI001F016230|nr:helix-hairpin-helix domain-containing protein [Streptomyces alboflavus]
MSTESAAAEVAEPEAPEAGAGPDAEDTPEAGSTPSGGAAPDGDPGDAEEHSADPEDAAPDSTGDGAEAGGGEGQDGSGDGGDTGVSEAEAELAAQRELRARIEQRKADKKGPVAAGAKLQGTAADLLAAVRAVESGEKPVAPVFREPAPVAPRRPAPEPVRRPVAEAPAGAGDPAPETVDAVAAVLAEGGAPAALAARAAAALGEGADDVLRADPWQLLRVAGVRPEQADGFARALLGPECGPGDERRGCALTVWLLAQAALAGHTALESSALTAALGQRGVPDPDEAVQSALAEGDVLLFQDPLDEAPGTAPRSAPPADDPEDAEAEVPVRVLLGLERYALAEESLADGLARVMNSLPKEEGSGPVGDSSPPEGADSAPEDGGSAPDGSGHGGDGSGPSAADWESAAAAAKGSAADLIRAVAAHGLVLHTGGEAARTEPAALVAAARALGLRVYAATHSTEGQRRLAEGLGGGAAGAGARGSADGSGPRTAAPGALGAGPADSSGGQMDGPAGGEADGVPSAGRTGEGATGAVAGPEGAGAVQGGDARAEASGGGGATGSAEGAGAADSGGAVGGVGPAGGAGAASASGTSHSPGAAGSSPAPGAPGALDEASPAVTVAGLLSGRQGPGRDADGALALDLLVVLDAPQLDVETAAMLVESLPDGARLVLSGDPGVLWSAGPGRVFADLLAARCCPQVVSRTPDPGPIGELVSGIGVGELTQVDAPGKEVVIVPVRDAPDAIHRTVQLVADSVPRAIGVPAGQTQVITPGHGGAAGTRALNAALKERLNPGPGRFGGFDPGDRVAYAPVPGRTALGRVVGADAQGLRLECEGTPVAVPKERVEQSVRHAWALTAHQATGRRWPAAVVVLPGDAAGALTRPWVYTAFSRAERHLSVVQGVAQALPQAVAERPAKERTTRLRTLLRPQAPAAG